MSTSNFHTAIELHRLDIDFTDYLVRLQTYNLIIYNRDSFFKPQNLRVLFSGKNLLIVPVQKKYLLMQLQRKEADTT